MADMEISNLHSLFSLSRSLLKMYTQMQLLQTRGSVESKEIKKQSLESNSLFYSQFKHKTDNLGRL